MTKAVVSLGGLLFAGKVHKGVACRKTLSSTSELPGLVSVLRLDEASKQSLVSMGYPPSVSVLLIEMFGKNAALIAKWFMQMSLFGREPTKDWFYRQRPSKLDGRDELTIYSKLADALATGNPEVYTKTKEELELYVDPNEVVDIERYIPLSKAGLRKALEGNMFFRHTIIKDIVSGKLKDLKPYAKLDFDAANRAYEEKKLFASGVVPAGMGHVLKRYPDGMMWIMAGDKCQLVGADMNNCGSTGLMSMDKGASMVVLYDSKRKAHVIFTLSPAQGNRVSGVEGNATTELKPVYNDYVLDAVKEVDGWLDLYHHNKINSLLKVRYMLGDHLVSYETLSTGGEYAHYKLDVNLPSGETVTVYTNGYTILTRDYLERFKYPEGFSDAGSQTTEGDKIKYILDQSARGSFLVTLPSLQAWMRSVGIQEPEAKGVV